MWFIYLIAFLYFIGWISEVFSINGGVAKNTNPKPNEPSQSNKQNELNFKYLFDEQCRKLGRNFRNLLNHKLISDFDECIFDVFCPDYPVEFKIQKYALDKKFIDIERRVNQLNECYEEFKTRGKEFKVRYNRLMAECHVLIENYKEFELECENYKNKNVELKKLYSQQEIHYKQVISNNDLLTEKITHEQQTEKISWKRDMYPLFVEIRRIEKEHESLDDYPPNYYELKNKYDELNRICKEQDYAIIKSSLVKPEKSVQDTKDDSLETQNISRTPQSLVVQDDSLIPITSPDNKDTPSDSIIENSFLKYGVSSLWHMTHKNNIKEILESGILSNTSAYTTKKPMDISNPGVQKRRDLKDPIYGRKIHDYAPAYINIKNPMLYVKQDIQHELCLIEISLKALLKHDFIFTDGNAAAHNTNFYNTTDNLIKLPWDVLNSSFWNGIPDGKRKRCCEVLVYPLIEPKHIIKIHCYSEDTLRYLAKFNVPAQISHELFFSSSCQRNHIEYGDDYFF